MRETKGVRSFRSKTRLDKDEPKLSSMAAKHDNYKEVLPQLSGFVCAYHPAAPGSSPKRTIYALSLSSQVGAIPICLEKRIKINKKMPGLTHFLQKHDNFFNVLSLLFFLPMTSTSGFKLIVPETVISGLTPWLTITWVTTSCIKVTFFRLTE